MGLTQGDYWVIGCDLPTAELARVLARARELTDTLADVSIGYGYDLGNNLDAGGPNTLRAVRAYESGAGS